MSSNKPATKEVFRSSVTGQFETKREAAKHPRESERQHIRTTPAPKKK